MAEVRAGGDHNARGAVDLAEQLVVHQHAAVLRREQVSPSSRRQPDFEAPAPGFRCDLGDGFVFADLTLFELGDPDFA
jgi:hypothetical protein